MTSGRLETSRLSSGATRRLGFAGARLKVTGFGTRLAWITQATRGGKVEHFVQDAEPHRAHSTRILSRQPRARYATRLMAFSRQVLA